MKNKNTVVYEHGINDMYHGWTTENKWNAMVYKKWCGMLERVYSEKLHEKSPMYTNTTLQLELHWLSYFAEYITEIDGYNENKFLKGELALDKDIKSNGKNKEYSINNCMFVSASENSKQAVATRNNNYLKGKNNWNHGGLSKETKERMSKTKKENGKAKGANNPRAKKVAQFDLNGNLIKIWDYAGQVSDKFGWNSRTFRRHLDGTCSSEYKGFIWKYVD